MDEAAFARLVADLGLRPGSALVADVRLAWVEGGSYAAIAARRGVGIKAVEMNMVRFRRELHREQARRAAEETLPEPVRSALSEEDSEEAAVLWAAMRQQYQGDAAEESYVSPDWWSPVYHGEAIEFGEVREVVRRGRERREWTAEYVKTCH